MDESLIPYLGDWLHLLARWLHITAAIAWVGASFYFIAVDYSLRAPRDEGRLRDGVAGESWEIHGGGFYRVEKYAVAPPELPESLHWYKWEAYTTWLSGFALLVLLYYVDARANLVDPTVADLAPWQAVGLSATLLVAGWLAYEALCRLLGDRERLLAIAVGLLVIAVTWVSGQLFSARAVSIEVGAVLGTLMAGNVLFVIIPGQRELVAAKRAGRQPDPRPGLRGKQRSVHNNYLTLPAVFAMISIHFPFTYGHANGWLVLLALMAVGAGVRHFFNLRHRGRAGWGALAASALGALVIVAALATARPLADVTADPPRAGPDFERAQAVIALRCVTCHSTRPTYPGMGAAPRGVTFDTPDELHARALRIYQLAVATKTMPLGNVTGMTQEERDALARWLRRAR